MKITDKRLLSLGYDKKTTQSVKMNYGYKKYYILINSVTGLRSFEHRVIWELYNGKIPYGYVIHHKDNNGLNNDPNNLECLSRTEHRITQAKEIFIDGVKMTLEEVMKMFGFNDKGNCIRSLKRYVNGSNDPRCKFTYHEVKYE